jgi:glyoxylase-like metal-dependent hydrolase (beta-lactamase superfamily II)
VRGDRGTLLVDAGSGGALQDTEHRLRAAGADPARLMGIALTHMHCDHAGGAAGLQARHATPVALHAAEAELVTSRSADAGDSRWLAHPFAPLRVDRALRDGDVLDDHGGPALVVVHLGAQTVGHVAFHVPDEDAVITGDLLQEVDVGWLPPGRAALDAALRALDRLEATGARTALPGHGPPVPDVPAAIERARLRYAAWLDEPERGAWHAIKRLGVSALQFVPPGPGEAPALLASTPWLRDYAADPLGVDPLALAEDVVAELHRVGAVRETADGLRPTGEHDPPGTHPYGPLRPADWPADLRARPGAWRWP